jgi:hypothetical protein
MARWRQVWNEEQQTHVMVPCDAQAAARDSGIIVKGNFDAFKSPIDGSVIRNHREYDDHCRKHNVVPAAEFSPEYYARKEKERASVFQGRHDKEAEWQRKAQINEIINNLG